MLFTLMLQAVAVIPRRFGSGFFMGSGLLGKAGWG
jgi:hypothetical protein